MKTIMMIALSALYHAVATTGDDQANAVIYDAIRFALVLQ